MGVIGAGLTDLGFGCDLLFFDFDPIINDINYMIKTECAITHMLEIKS